MNFKIHQITVKLNYMKIRFLSAFIVIFLFQTNAYAYLEPGSYSIIVQILATLGVAIASVYLSIKLKIKESMNKIKKIFSKKKD